MQKSKKRILGAAGLSLVAGMTVVAYNIQTPSAYADEPAVLSTNTLKVTVLSNNLDIDISGPIQDGSSTSLDNVTIPLIVTDALKIQYQVTANQAGKSSAVVADDIITLTDRAQGYSGVYNLELTLKNYKDYLMSNYGYVDDADITFSLYVKAIGYGSGIAEDGISFAYGNVTIDPSDNIKPDAPDDETNVDTNDKGDPIIHIEVGDDATKVHVIIKDKDTGEVVWEGDVDVTPGSNDITLPFAENGIPSGNYEIIIGAYSASGAYLGTSSLVIRYVQPDGMGVPNTGGVSIAGLNIAQSDFLISSALAFCLVAAGGIFLIRRNQTRK